MVILPRGIMLRSGSCFETLVGNFSIQENYYRFDCYEAIVGIISVDRGKGLFILFGNFDDLCDGGRYRDYGKNINYNIV